MDRDEVTAGYERAWAPWRAAVHALDPAQTRLPGVCGSWTAHDVVGHVQSYERFWLMQVRGAFTLDPPSAQDIAGDRAPMPPGTPNEVHARNEAIRVSGLSLTWNQLLEECDWLRAETLRFVAGLSDDELAEEVGIVHFWTPEARAEPRNVDGLMVRRVAEMPSAFVAMPVGRLVQPDEPDRHVSEHLAQLTSWAGALS